MWALSFFFFFFIMDRSFQRSEWKGFVFMHAVRLPTEKKGECDFSLFPTRLDKNRNLESSCTMSFADTSGDLPSVFPVRIRLRFRGTGSHAVRESQGPRKWKYTQVYNIQPPPLRFHLLSIYVEIIIFPSILPTYFLDNDNCPIAK